MPVQPVFHSLLLFYRVLTIMRWILIFDSPRHDTACNLLSFSGYYCLLIFAPAVPERYVYWSIYIEYIHVIAIKRGTKEESTMNIFQLISFYSNVIYTK